MLDDVCSFEKEFLIQINTRNIILYVVRPIVQLGKTVSDKLLVGQYAGNVGLKNVCIEWLHYVAVCFGFKPMNDAFTVSQGG